MMRHQSPVSGTCQVTRTWLPSHEHRHSRHFTVYRVKASTVFNATRKNLLNFWDSCRLPDCLISEKAGGAEHGGEGWDGMGLGGVGPLPILSLLRVPAIVNV
ncbi:hypothetical protein E2C01_043927 [Portunus trituberculatus]|uniref:Uncharacterized protein n=1 Tax=Portunus trituberculatus TaxID=210409 RepID=A0A5B7FXP5_PORTR|nr:hypothetical protein [Portunus trituberculatus]